MLSEKAREYLNYKKAGYNPKRIPDRESPFLPKHDFVSVSEIKRSIEGIIKNW
jgi:hypothetical protein